MEPNEQELNMLEEAGAYEVMANTKGWELTKNFITEKIQQFTNRAIIDGFKTMDEYMFYRGEVAGLRSLLVEVDNSLQNLKNYREKQQRTDK